MINKTIDFIYNYFDIIGPTPKLYIFKNERYQSIYSLILSLIILIITIAFILYSFINYFENDRPTVTYSKSNDENEQRKVPLKNTLIMFQFIDFSTLKKIDSCIVSFKGKYTAIYDNATSETIKLNINSCNLGVNLNPKYENYFREKISSLAIDYNKTDKNIEDFYCITSENDINLFYYPNIGSSSILLDVVIHNQSLYSPEDISIMMIYENNLINHNDKKSPISEGMAYQFIQGFSTNDFTSIGFNFQYLKYETDDGLLFDNLNYLNGMSFLDMTYFKSKINYYESDNEFSSKSNSNTIGRITLAFNKSNYDYYRRTYKKLQALIAEISSIVSIIFEIGRQILSFLSEKKMSVDVIRNLFNVENKKNISIKQLNHERDKNIPNKLNNSFEITEKKGICIQPNDNKNEEVESRNEKILKDINVFNIIKSFFCNSHKDKLISLCHDIIIQDICIETILERFYKLLRVYYSILEVEKYNLGLNKEPRFRKINATINNIINRNNSNINQTKT